MLKTDKDRLNYSRVLKAPDGFEYKAAVCTTYSMSLEMLANAVLTLGLGESYESQILSKNPICLLNAIQNVCSSLAVFCEAGQMNFRGKAESVAILFERSIVQVALPKLKNMDRYPSFHPKMWLIKYENETGERRYRLIVLSRNLTFDKSLDVCAVIEGYADKSQKSNAKPLADFLRFLRGQITGGFQGDKEKREMLDTLQTELAGVVFKPEDDSISDIEIIPTGIGKGGYDIENSPLFKRPAQGLIVMSPFLTSSVVKQLNECAKDVQKGRAVLITRRETLKDISQKACCNLQPYALKEEIIQFDSGDADGTDWTQPDIDRDIHAKLYVREEKTARNKKPKVEIFLGSMNASKAGVSQNTEILLRLVSDNGSITVEQILTDIFCGPAGALTNPFEPAEPGKDSKGASNEIGELEKQVKELCRCGAGANAAENSGAYDLHVEFPGQCSDKNIYVCPVMTDCNKQLAAKIQFNGLAKLDLSQFYTITVKGTEHEIKRVIMIPTKGIPQDEENAVKAYYLNNEEAFLKYIFIMFSDRKLADAIKMDEAERCGAWKKSGTVPVAIYETMVKSAMTAPDRFRDNMRGVASLMDILKENKGKAPEFQKLYEAFRKTKLFGEER